MEMECPNCNEEFKGELWEDGRCPGCGLHYSWDEYYEDEDEFRVGVPIIDWSG